MLTQTRHRFTLIAYEPGRELSTAEQTMNHGHLDQKLNLQDCEFKAGLKLGKKLKKPAVYPFRSKHYPCALISNELVEFGR
jgi:hypothetical protein